MSPDKTITCDHAAISMESAANPSDRRQVWFLQRPRSVQWTFSSGQFLLLLCALVFAMFPGVVLGKQIFVCRDFGLFSYPVALFQRQCFWRGELPLWDPYNLCGVPFLAQWNTMCLYPPALFYLLLPLTWALPMFCLLHLVWGGFGMFQLARQWTGNNLAAALAGIVFSFNGLTLNFLMWPSHIATWSWLPWLLWIYPMAWREGGRKLACAALVGSLQMLAGGPETILLTWSLLVLLLVSDLVNGPRQQNSRLTQTLSNTRRFFALILLVALISAVQLLPFLRLLAHSQRDAGYSALAANWSMPAWGWVNFLVPLFRMTPTPEGLFLQPGQYWTSSYYVGIGTVLLAVLGLWYSRECRVRVLGLLVLLGLLLALGEHGFVYPIVRTWLPGVGLVRYPIKFVMLTVALAPLLAAWGLAAILQQSGSAAHSQYPPSSLGAPLRSLALRGSFFSAFLLLALIAAVLAYGRTSGSMAWPECFTSGLSRAGFLLLITAAFWLLCRKKVDSRATQLPTLAGVMLVLLCWLDLLTHVPSQNPTALPRVFAQGWARNQQHWSSLHLGDARAMISPEAVAALKFHAVSNPGNTFLLQRLGLLADCNLLDGVPEVHGFFSLAPAQINEVTSALYVLTNRDFSPLLDFMGVRLISAPGDPFQWESRSSAMPLISAGQRPVSVDDRTAFVALSQTHTDLRQVVLLPPETRVTAGASAVPTAQVLEPAYQDSRISFNTLSPEPTLVTIAQTYDAGWHAYLDGHPTPLWRANYAFQALQVPAGPHHVELKYQDWAFRTGVILSLLGALLWLGLLLPGCGVKPRRGGRLVAVPRPHVVRSPAPPVNP
jgi:hypothetical protein